MSIRSSDHDTDQDLAPRPKLARLLDDAEDADDDILLDRFLRYVAEKNLALYPAQEEAILELASRKNVVLNTPTGSGKSLVATAMHYFARARGERSFYTCPIKALVSEKFFALCNEFGPDDVGMMTGDATVNRDAPIICCTAEVLSNMALREGKHAAVDCVVMDEFHYYADRDRGVAWQIPLLTLPQTRFLLMSATLGDTKFFEEKLTKLTGIDTALVRSSDRPVPLDFSYRETALHETIADLLKESRAPIYVVNFTQRGAAEEAQNLMSVDFCSKEEKRAINVALDGVKWASPYGKEVQKFLRHGVGIHHAGLLPKYRLLVEKLAQRGHLKIICGTDTLGVGVNIPIRTVLFTKLCKFDGVNTAILSVRDFQQISGRAGRKGFDTKGSVVVQAPEHVIENMRLDQKAGGDKAKMRKLVRKKPPERGYVPWDVKTFERLTTSMPEPLLSRFQVTHAMLLNVLQRPDSGCRAMARLIKDSHESEVAKRKHGRLAFQMFSSLRDAGVITMQETASGGHRAIVNVDLQEDFSLNQALSLYVLETVEDIDPESETYALDVLTLVESSLENPELILIKQLDRIKTLKMSEMKAAGVEYDERIAELEKLEYPKPNKDFIYDSFNAFASRHPWVGTENIRPKSVAREMYETYQSFGEYIREYDLQRAEGLLLRYVSDVYKALSQTVPEAMKTEEIDDIVAYFGEMIRNVDSSLLDEWERMRSPRRLALGTAHEDDDGAETAEEARARASDITRDVRGFTVLVRNAVFSLLRALATRDYEGAAELVASGDDDYWTAARLEEALRPFYDDHSAIRTDPGARNPAHMRIDRERGHEGVWRVDQVLVDPDDHNDWVLEIGVDLARSREASRPRLTLRRVGA
jgi:superfamily II RNA helicase